MRSNQLSSFTTGLVLLALVSALAATGAAGQVPPPAPMNPNSWIGAPGTGGNWDDPNKWSLGHYPGQPGVGANETAVIPGDRGAIVAPPGGIIVRGIVEQPSTDPNAANHTTITGSATNLDVKIFFSGGDIYIGGGSTIEGKDGALGQNGGQLFIEGDGDVVNDGELESGDGANSGPGVGSRQGGRVHIKCRKLSSKHIKSGKGGNWNGGGDGCLNGGGRSGGIVDIVTTSTTDTSDLGTVDCGSGGTGTPEGTGGQLFHNGRRLGFTDPGQHIDGDHISLFVTDPLNLSGAHAGLFMAIGGTIRIDAPSIDLTGIAAGTQVFQANDVCLPCNLSLDPGVTIQSLCGSATVHCSLAPGKRMSPVLMSQNLETTGGQLPAGWTATTIQGAAGFNIVSGANIFPPEPRFECNALSANAQSNGGNATVCTITTLPMNVVVLAAAESFTVGWNERYNRTSPGGFVQMSIVVNNVPTPVWNTSVSSAPYDFVKVDITPFLPPAGTDFSLRWRFQGAGTDSFLLDNIFVTDRPGFVPIVGQPATPGVSVLDIGDSRNADGIPAVHVSFPGPVFGPFFTDVPVNTTTNVHVEGPANGTITFGQSFVMPGTMFFPGIGQLDLDLNGLALPLMLPLSPLGGLDLPVFIPPPLAGFTLGIQAVVVGPSGAGLTNAVEVRFR